MAAKGETVFSLQELVGGHNLRFQTKNGSKSVEITDTATSVQEKHGRAQVGTSSVRQSVQLTGQFVAGALRDDTKYGCVVD